MKISKRFENDWKYNENRMKYIQILKFLLITLEIPKKENAALLDYIIWANNENISRIRLAKTLYLDCTFPHPIE